MKTVASLVRSVVELLYFCFLFPFFFNVFFSLNLQAHFHFLEEHWNSFILLFFFLVLFWPFSKPLFNYAPLAINTVDFFCRWESFFLVTYQPGKPPCRVTPSPCFKCQGEKHLCIAEQSQQLHFWFDSLGWKQVALSFSCRLLGFGMLFFIFLF